MPLSQDRGRFLVRISDLPSPVRLEILRRDLDALHLDPGTYDDEARDDFMLASPTRRARAERKAAVARLLVSLGSSASWPERIRLVREKFGDEGTSKPSLKRLLSAVEGVDPINYAPALLDDYKSTARRAEMSEKAWRFFMTTIRDAAPDFPLKAAWRDTRDTGRSWGWSVPSYPTFYRRWEALNEAERLHARYGRGAAHSRLVQPAHRDKSTLSPLAWVSLDGRVQDFWVDFGDGKPVRPIMLALIDVASNIVLGWELASSENAARTVRLIKNVCQRHGIFDRLYTDNGSAFAGHLVAGGNVHRFRNGRKKAEGVQPPGICQIMGIDLTFALPKNAQVRKNGWIYGGPSTQQVLLTYPGTGGKILLGRDPDDFSAPAIAFDEAGRLICEGIEPVQAGSYDSVDGIRDAARNRKAARAAVAAAEMANNYLDDARFAEALAALGPRGMDAEGAQHD